jgi:hypothetical protein
MKIQKRKKRQWKREKKRQWKREKNKIMMMMTNN